MRTCPGGPAPLCTSFVPCVLRACAPVACEQADEGSLHSASRRAASRRARRPCRSWLAGTTCLLTQPHRQAYGSLRQMLLELRRRRGRGGSTASTHDACCSSHSCGTLCVSGKARRRCVEAWKREGAGPASCRAAAASTSCEAARPAHTPACDFSRSVCRSRQLW